MTAVPRQRIFVAPGWLSALRAPIGNRGRDVGDFESAAAAFAGFGAGVAMPSGRTGLWALLKSLDPDRRGREVVLSAFNFFAVPRIVELAGYEPRFADVDPETFGLDPGALDRAVGPNTAAVVATHCLGRPCDMERIIEIAGRARVPVIVDSAHGIAPGLIAPDPGSILGAILSFEVSKPINTGGGGMVLTSDPGVERQVRALAQGFFARPGSAAELKVLVKTLLLGMATGPLFHPVVYPGLRLLAALGREAGVENPDPAAVTVSERIPGFSDLRARLGLGQIKALARRNAARARNAALLQEILGDLACQPLPPGEAGQRIPLMFVSLMSEDPALAARKLLERGIDAKRDYLSYCPELFPGVEPGPVAAKVAERLILVACHPELTADRVRAMGAAISQLARRQPGLFLSRPG